MFSMEVESHYKQWRRRYFRLWSNKTLEYFKNEKSEKVLKKPIDLNKCKSIDGNLKNKKWDNIFCLNTEYRKFFLVADSSDGMERWISKLCEICGFTEQGQGEIEDPPKIGLKQMQDSPSYCKIYGSVGSNQEDEGKESMSNNLPSYEKDLPPLPDSSSSEGGDETEMFTSDSPQPIIGSPFSSGIKQNKSNRYEEPLRTAYDMVPAPRPAVEDVNLNIPSSYPKRRVSTPSESAMKNMTINDESYVDMQQPDPSLYDAVPKSSSTLRYQPQGYDFVPPPKAVNKADLGNHGIYDLVPKPVEKQDEYIPCEILNHQVDKVLLPVPHPTYNGFDTLPADKKVLQRRTNEDDTYDIPPRNSEFIASLGNGRESYDSGIADSIFSDVSGVSRYDGSLYDTPPINDHKLPFSSHREKQDRYETRPVSDGNEIYDVPPVPSRDDKKRPSCPPVPNQYETQDIYDTPPVPNRNDAQDIYDTPPVPNRNDVQDIYDTPPVPNRNDVQDIYNTPPVPNRNDAQDMYDTPPVPNRNDAQDMYDTPPVPNRNNAQDIYDTPPIPNGTDAQDTYDTLPAPTRNVTQDIYDIPPPSNEDEIYDTPPLQIGKSKQDVKGKFINDSLYDILPPSEISNQQHGLLYAPVNQRSANQNDLYDVPPMSQSQVMSQSHGSMQDNQTSPADLFNFGFSLSPPSVDRSLKYASTGLLDSGKSMPPPVDRKTRPVMTTSVPVFPSQVERDFSYRNQDFCDQIYDAPPPRPEGAHMKK